MKKGNRIIVIENENELSIGIFYNVGDTGTIVKIVDSDPLNVEVQFDEGSLNATDTWWIKGSSIELLKEEV